VTLRCDPVIVTAWSVRDEGLAEVSRALAPRDPGDEAIRMDIDLAP
jgi:hypothetical protein